MLDVACGPGWHAKQLVAKGADVIGCDGSPKMVELAQAAVGRPDAFRVHECDDPFDWVPDQSVDLVVMALAYHYVNDHDHFLAEITEFCVPELHS